MSAAAVSSQRGVPRPLARRLTSPPPPPLPRPWCRSYSHPDYGCTDESDDLEAAVIQSYLWAITGNETYAQHAVTILNSYGHGLKEYTLSNAPLQSAWSGIKYARAGELLTSTGAPWAASDLAAFKRMLLDVVVPLNFEGSCANGNWELAMAESLVSIGVFTENATVYNQGIALWRKRVPGYFYISSDGPKPLPAGSCGTPFWYNQSVFNSSVEGVCQETCRDFGHTGYGIASSFNIAETARAQGLDLLAEQADRLAAASEFHATWINTGAASPGVNISSPLLCSGAHLNLAQPPTFQVGMTAFGRVNRSLPHTAAYVHNILWQSPAPTEMFMAIFEPLTHGSAPPAAAASE